MSEHVVTAEQQCAMPRCSNLAVDPSRPGALCESHLSAFSSSESGGQGGDGATTVEEERDTSGDERRSWGRADFTAPESDTWPASWVGREFWMARRGKQPFAPWGDKNHPDGECTNPNHDAEMTDRCSCDARFKWSLTDNWANKGTADEWVEMHPLIDGHVVLLQKADDPYNDDPDPYGFVDGDDVRCPETGEVHPGFIALLNQLGITYADVSNSRCGVHAAYEGQLPDKFADPQAAFEIDDEPWGANDDRPSVEIYDGKRVCVVTGEHVPGSAEDVQPWDVDALAELLEEYVDDDEQPAAEHDTDHERADMDDYTPSATRANETTGDIRDVFAAIDRLRPADLRLRTRQVGTEATGWEMWDPSTYRSSGGNDSLHTADREAWYDQKYGQSFGLLGLYAAEQGIISKPWHSLKGETFWKVTNAARDDGAPIPKFDPGADETVAAVPFERIAEWNDDDARRFLRERGYEWPNTTEAREQLRNRVLRAIRDGECVVADAPTGLGKSHTVASEPWLYRTDITRDAPVIHLSPTRDARDENIEKSRAAGVSAAALKGRKDRCPMARGDHDPNPDDQEEPELVLTVDGEPVSAWIDRQCDEKGNPFQRVHACVAEYNDQGHEPPCTAGDTDCPAMSQWDGVPRDDEGDPAVDVVHATHPFIYVPGLRLHTNIVIDEAPTVFTVDMEQDRIRRAVNAYLDAIGAPLKSYEGLVTLAESNEYQGDIGIERDELENVLGNTPDEAWYIEHPNAHALAPDLTRAIYRAIRWEDTDANGRRSTRVIHAPPRFDDHDDGFGGNFLSVVVDQEYTVRSIRHAPDLSQARSVIGLDAHPCEPLWKRNIGPDITCEQLLEPDERRLWRRFERGLTVVAVGDATRPLSGRSARQWFDNDWKLDVLLEKLTERYGDDFRSGITGARVERAFQARMEDAGVADPKTMHFGEEASRNDFSGERVGLVNGCIDPGDDYVVDVLAELGLDAQPERSTPHGLKDPRDALCPACGGRRCSQCNDTGLKRAPGRGFSGPDAETAAEVLANVRESHVAQAAGRYARNADDPDDTAIVYVRTNAIPEGFAGVTVEGVVWTATDTQREIIDALAERGSEGATAKGLAEDIDCSARHVQKTLGRIEERGIVQRAPGRGPNPDRWFAAMETTEDVDQIDLLDPTNPPKSSTVADDADNDEKARTGAYRTPIRDCSRFSADNERVDGSTEIDALLRADGEESAPGPLALGVDTLHEEVLRA